MVICCRLSLHVEALAVETSASKASRRSLNASGTARVSVRLVGVSIHARIRYAAERIGTRHVPVRVPAYGYTQIFFKPRALSFFLLSLGTVCAHLIAPLVYISWPAGGSSPAIRRATSTMGLPSAGLRAVSSPSPTAAVATAWHLRPPRGPPSTIGSKPVITNVSDGLGRGACPPATALLGPTQLVTCAPRFVTQAGAD